jgi:hypothetical protein
MVEDVYLRSRKVGSTFEVKKGSWIGEKVTTSALSLKADEDRYQIIEGARGIVKIYFTMLLDGINNTLSKHRINAKFCPKFRSEITLSPLHTMAMSLQLYTMLGTGSMKLSFDGDQISGLVLFDADSIEKFARYKTTSRKKLRVRTPLEKEVEFIKECLYHAKSHWGMLHTGFPSKKPIGFGVKQDEVNKQANAIVEQLARRFDANGTMSPTAFKQQLKTIVREHGLLSGRGEKSEAIKAQSAEFTKLFVQIILEIQSPSGDVEEIAN